MDDTYDSAKYDLTGVRGVRPLAILRIKTNKDDVHHDAHQNEDPQIHLKLRQTIRRQRKGLRQRLCNCNVWWADQTDYKRKGQADTYQSSFTRKNDSCVESPIYIVHAENYTDLESHKATTGD